MQKHAYCILVHNEPKLLQSLLAQLDDERNDIFIHLDAKADARLFERISCERARMFWTPRIRVYWCDFSTTEAELLLFRFARSHGHYAYYHLISGADRAIKSQNYIHSYCETHNGEEFVEYTPDAKNLHQVDDRIHRWYFFTKMHRHPNGKVRRLFVDLDNAILNLQRVLHIRRNGGLVPSKGSNWFSITENLVDWLLPQEDEIRRTYHHTFCAEETFLQTMLMRSPFANRVSPGGNMREIDWKRGDPYVWRLEDFDYLAASPCFFARKFSSAHIDIVDKINAQLT